MSDRQKKITWEDWVQEAEFAPLSPTWDKLSKDYVVEIEVSRAILGYIGGRFGDRL